jgi:hypothetical protein
MMNWKILRGNCCKGGGEEKTKIVQCEQGFFCHHIKGKIRTVQYPHPCYNASKSHTEIAHQKSVILNTGFGLPSQFNIHDRCKIKTLQGSKEQSFWRHPIPIVFNGIKNCNMKKMLYSHKKENIITTITVIFPHEFRAG